MTTRKLSGKKRKKGKQKKLLDAETRLTLIYIGIAVVLVGGVVAVMLYGPPDERLLRSIPACDGEMARTAIEKGANVNITTGVDALITNAPVLFIAARKGCLEIMKLLLSNGADVNMTVNGKLYTGWTALMAAAEQGNTALIRLLLEHGADPSRSIPEGDKQGWTALTIAESEGHTEIVHIVTEATAEE